MVTVRGLGPPDSGGQASRHPQSQAQATVFHRDVPADVLGAPVARAPVSGQVPLSDAEVCAVAVEVAGLPRQVPRRACLGPGVPRTPARLRILRAPDPTHPRSEVGTEVSGESE